MHIEMFFDRDSSTCSYVVADFTQRKAAVIDPVLNYDAMAGVVSTEGADAILYYLQQHRLTLQWVLETHAHADHLSAAQYLKQHTSAVVAIGEGIITVQHTFKQVFDLSDNELMANGDHFDKLFADHEQFNIGALAASVINTPGHTNDSVSYLIEGALFVGDSLFMPDGGTARCDFPGGDAHLLYRSVQRIYTLPDATPIYICHDYQPGGRELKYITSVAEQKAANIHINATTSEQEFVQRRITRDKTLAVPRLIYPAVQVNIRAGLLPTANAAGQRFIKVPLKGWSAS